MDVDCPACYHRPFLKVGKERTPGKKQERARTGKGGEKKNATPKPLVRHSFDQPPRKANN
jgi:hypothetical protein